MKNKKSGKGGKIVLVAVIVVGAIVFRCFDLGQYFSLEYIKAFQESFQSLYQAHWLSVIAAYMAVYIAITALSLPEQQEVLQNERRL